MPPTEYPTLTNYPTRDEVRDYYLRPEILAELFYATRVRDVALVYPTPGPLAYSPTLQPNPEQRASYRIDLQPADPAELAAFIREIFDEPHGPLTSYPWFTVYYGSGAYGEEGRHPIGWDAAVELDFGWRRSFSELYGGLEILDDFGVHYRGKFSGCRSLHLILPAEAMPEPYRATPDRAAWLHAMERVGAYIDARSRHRRHGWIELVDEPQYSAPYSVHRQAGLAAVPLARSDYRQFRPWMAALPLAAPLADWWRVPADAGANFQRLLDHVAANKTIFTVPVERNLPGYVPAARQRHRSLARPVAEALADLRDADVDRRRRAAWSLIAHRPDDLDALCIAVDDPDRVVRHFALEALYAHFDAVGDRERIAALTAGRLYGDEYDAQITYDLLSECGATGIETILHLARRHPDSLWAVRDWAEKRGPTAIATLLGYLQNDDPRLRSAAQQVLGMLVRRAAPQLVECLSSDDADLRLRALAILLEIREGALPILALAAQHGESAVALARQAIAALSDDRPAPADLPVTNIARLLAFDDALALPLIVHQLDSPEKHIRFMAARALARFGDEAVPAFIDLTTHPDPALRRRAVERLRDLAPAAARDALLKTLADPDNKVRQNAVRALARIGRDDDLQAIAALRDDPSRAVRRTVAAALANA